MCCRLMFNAKQTVYYKRSERFDEKMHTTNCTSKRMANTLLIEKAQSHNHKQQTECATSVAKSVPPQILSYVRYRYSEDAYYMYLAIKRSAAATSVPSH